MSDPKSWSKYVAFLVYLNGLGILLEEGYLPTNLLYKMDQAGWLSIRVWLKFKDVILSTRESQNNPDVFKYVEFYAEEMIKLRIQEGKPTHWSEELFRFID